MYKKKRKPTVSFVIRTKNEGRFIGKVLRFVHQQTFEDFEVIIVDSGSTDRTLEKVKKYPVRLLEIKPEEFNFSYALNLGIKHSKGKFICIISGHSIPISDTWLKDGMGNFKDKKVAAVTGHCTSFPIGYFNRNVGRMLFSPRVKTKNNTPWMTNSNSIIKKDLWKIYPFNEKLSGTEDYDWACEMLSRGYKIIKDKRFGVFHSHFLLGRPGHRKMSPIWKNWVKEIDKKKRPGESYTRLKI